MAGLSKKINYLKDIFFQNSTTKQTVFKNTFWLYFGFGLSNLINFLLLVYVTRALGVIEFGKFAFALGFISLFAIFGDVGLGAIIIREFSQKEIELEELYSIISLKFVLGLLMLVLTSFGSFFITSDNSVREIIIVLALFTFISLFIELSYLIFKARQRMEYQAWMQSLVSFVTIIFCFAALFYSHSAKSVSYGYLAASCLSLLIIVFLFHYKLFILKIFWNKSIWKKFLLMSWPLAFAGIFSTIYGSIDSVILGYLGQIAETGWYNAAYRIARASFLLAAIIFSSLYPILNIASRESKEKTQKIWDYQINISFSVTLPMVLGGIILASNIVSFAYGSGFNPSVLALQILMVMAGFLMFYSSFINILTIYNHQKKFFWTALLGAIVNVILNALLIPKYSLYGAAVATVITHFLIFVLLLYFVLKYTPIKPFNANNFLVFFGIIISSIIMAFVISLPAINNFSILFSIPIGILVYIIALLILKVIWKQLIPAESAKIKI